MKKIILSLIFFSSCYIANAQKNIITDPGGGIIITPTITEVGNTEGQLSVSLSGAASYIIPISVPPGINGVVPQISLNYSSQAGNGMAGYGWNIGGLSAITRVPKDKYHDGEIATVNIVADVFALDGQRLLLKPGSPATYGKNGAIYETENYSNIKVTSYSTGTLFACPDSFKVEYPDGSVAIYGGATGTNNLYAYAINYWQNAQGVRIHYTYNLANNFSTIASIKYGSTFANTPINEIQFVYKNRTRIEEYYGAETALNNKILNTTILSKIKIFGNNIGFKNYDFTHDTAIGYDRLKSITEKTGNNMLSYRPTIFKYDENITNNLVTRNIESRYLPIDGSPKTLITGDFDGDGDIDFISKDKLFTKFYDDGSIPIITELPAPLISNPDGNTKPYSIKCMEANGKLMDRNAWCQINYNRQNINNILTIQKNYDVFSKNPTTNSITLEYSRQVVSTANLHYDFIGDFNGDGLTDFMLQEYYHTSIQHFGRLKFLNLDRRITTNNFAKDLGLLPADFRKMEVADVNGDGKTDILFFIVGTTFNGIKVYSLDANENLVFQWQTPVPFDLNGGDLFYEEIPPSEEGHLDVTPIYGNLVQVPPPIIGYNYTWIPDFLGAKYSYPVVMGDYNGDGKTDIILPGLERLVLISTGNTFTSESLPNDFPDRHNLGILMPVDFNDDGKTDVLNISFAGTNYSINNFSRFNPNNWTNSISNYNDYNPNYTNNTIGLLPLLIKNSKVYANKPQLIMRRYHGNNFQDILFLTNQNSLTNQKLLSSITFGNGVQEKITYSPLTTANGVYTPAGQVENYPNFDIAAAPGWKVVSQIEKVSKTSYRKQQFKYYGAVSNVEGLGFQGFRGRLATNWYSDPSEIISNITKHDISLRGAVTESFSVLGLSSPSAAFSSPFISHAINTYNMVRSRAGLRYVNPLLSNKVYKLFNSSSENWDGLNGATSSQTSTLYDGYNNPVGITTDYLNNGNLEKSSYTNIDYYNSLPTDLVYYRGRPKSKIVNETIYDTATGMTDDTSSQELYAYQNHLLTQVKKKGHQTIDELIEDNIYDVYGNITKKTITATGLTPRVTNYEYDIATNRFLTKKIDIEGLETVYTNDRSSGMLLTETLPAVVAPYLPRTTTYVYDKWYKLLNVTDYLGKKVSYTYENNAVGVLKTIKGDDGSNSILQIDDLGRKIKTGTQNIDGTWSYITKVYGGFGDRLISETAPYNSNASPYDEVFDFSEPIWNESEYDVYGRVIRSEAQKTNSAGGKIITYSYSGLSTTETDTSTSKIKTTIKNSLGNIVSVSDNLGGTIDYKYFANGNLKETNCNNSIITITQDGWGRKKSLYEPSVGSYLYDYNNFGETIRETVVGKGKTEYNINAVGKVIDKKIFDPAGNLLTKNTYTYNPTTKLLSNTRFDDYANTSYTLYDYLYDTYKRVISSDESLFQNNVAQTYFKQTTSFDAFGRPDVQETTAINKPDGKQMVKAIKNTYKLGYHHTILENGTNKLLWRTNTVDARGQLTSGTYGNNINVTNTYDDYSYPAEKKLDLFGSTILTQNTTFDHTRGNLTSRTNSLFNWSENFTYDSLDRLLTYKDNAGIQTQNYNPNGSIRDNNVGSYAYTTAGMPFRASTITPPDQSITSPVMSYYLNRDQNITYNVFKSPITIKEQNKENIDFEYNADNDRAVMYYGNLDPNKLARPIRKFYSADGTMEIIRNSISNRVEFIMYLGGDGYDAPIVNKLTYDATTPSGAGGLFYLHRDYQGSIIGITNSKGQVVEKRLFDAWGALIQYQNAITGATTPPTGLGGAGMFIDRGYTGHEHLLNVGLINMNGRIYDPKLHHFLQPDNNIQDPYNTQNYNRYGYVLNNPMKYTDPSGEFWNVIFGYIAAAYIYGASANGGELNPTKWDFNNMATYGAPLQMISVYASTKMTNVANNYLQSYGANPVMPSIEQVATINEKPTFVFQNQTNYAPDPGHFSQWTPNWRERWGMSENLFAQMSYETVNAFGLFGQLFMFRSVGDGSMRNIDGSRTTSNQAADGVASLAGVAVAEMAVFAKTAQVGLTAAKGGQTIIGEGMKRVGTVAAQNPGSVILNTMPKFTGTANQVTSQMMTYNRQWILQQMRSGRPILDIGLDATRANPSIFYQMEQNMMKNYLKLHPNAFQIIK